MAKNTSPVRSGADQQSKFQALFIWDFYTRSERRGKFLEIIHRQRIIIFQLKKRRFYFTSPVVLRIYGRTSLHLSKTLPPEK